ncbi:hypothetical protein GOODEAATRI_001469 [Goodea atripinnis]|uniref:Uncharacterized protein n=1 Tax=Goodea atripinnis TaxID=208336 RepID=A0ABV0PAN3_9TELE
MFKRGGCKGEERICQAESQHCCSQQDKYLNLYLGMYRLIDRPISLILGDGSILSRETDLIHLHKGLKITNCDLLLCRERELIDRPVHQVTFVRFSTVDNIRLEY